MGHGKRVKVGTFSFSSEGVVFVSILGGCGVAMWLYSSPSGLMWQTKRSSTDRVHSFIHSLWLVRWSGQVTAVPTWGGGAEKGREGATEGEKEGGRTQRLTC